MPAPSYPRPEIDRRIVLFSVFGDESHDGRKQRVFAVAGLFGSEDDWKRINSKWLERTGGIVFHGADCETDQGDFADTSHDLNLKLYRDLTRLVCDSPLLGYGCAMDLAGFREVFPQADPNAPYYRCFRDVIMHCANHAYHSLEQERVKFTFDNRIETEYNAAMLYDFMVRLPQKDWKCSPFLFEEISFGNRKLPEIQMADLVARETMKHLDNLLGPVNRPTRGSMRALLGTRRFEALYLMREHFEDFRRKHEGEMDKWASEYQQWLMENNRQDDPSNRQLYTIQIDIPRLLNLQGRKEGKPSAHKQKPS